MRPPEDRDMELREHISEMRDRAIKALIPYLIVLGALFYKSEYIITFLWNDLFQGKSMVIYYPLEYLISRLLISAFLAFIATYPWIIYQIYLFMKPGLYEHERSFLRLVFPFSYISFVVGALLSYFVILPVLYSTFVVEYFGAEPYLSVKESLLNSIKLTLSIGLAFQIPTVTLVAVKLRLASSKWLREKRILVYLAVFILATNITFDITGFSQMIILTAVVVMYELSILIAKVFESGKNEKGIADGERSDAA